MLRSFQRYDQKPERKHKKLGRRWCTNALERPHMRPNGSDRHLGFHPKKFIVKLVRQLSVVDYYYLLSLYSFKGGLKSICVLASSGWGFGALAERRHRCPLRENFRPLCGEFHLVFCFLNDSRLKVCTWQDNASQRVASHSDILSSSLLQYAGGSKCSKW